MFPQRLQEEEEEEEEEEESGKLVEFIIPYLSELVLAGKKKRGIFIKPPLSVVT